MDVAWEPQNNPVSGSGEAEVNNGQQPESPAQEGRPDVSAANCLLCLALMVECSRQPLLLREVQPLGFPRMVLKRDEHKSGQDNSGQTFQKKHPLPAGQLL